MKRTSATCLGLMMLLAATSNADEKAARPSSARRVRLDNCKITLIDDVMLAADRTGILKSIEFKEGQSVAADARIALIADEVAAATLAVAEKKATNRVEIEFQEIAKIAAERALERMIDANKKFADKSAEGGRSVAPHEIDKAKLDADKAALSVKHAEHEMEVAIRDRDVKAAELKTYSVIAPFDGVITQILKKRGEAVKQGDPLVKIINTDRVRVEGRIKLADLRYAKEGAKVLVKLSVEDLDYPEENEIFEGKITFVDLVSDPIAKTTRVYAEVQNRDNILRSGLDAEMEIQVDEKATANTARVSKVESNR